MRGPLRTMVMSETVFAFVFIVCITSFSSSKAENMTSLHLSKLFDKIVSEPVHNLVHGNVNRAPRYWRLQKKVSSKTMDSDLEELVEELDAIDEVCREMIDIHKVYCSVATELVLSSQRIVNSFHILTHYSVLASDINRFEVENAWENAKRYQVALEEISCCLKEALFSIPSLVDVKIRELLSMLAMIHKQINKRDKALAQYESLHDKYDSMTILSATKQLSAKQRNEYFSLEKAMDEAKAQYSNLNSIICMELPYYFMLIRKFMEPVLEFMYFVHLTLAYQTHLNFASLREEMELCNTIETKSFLLDHMRNFKVYEPLDLNKLTIIRFHRDYLEQLVAEGVKTPLPSSNGAEFCIALYDYNSEVPEDLIFCQGDTIKIKESSGDWWEGEIDGRRGIFPKNYVATYKVPFLN